MHTVNYRRNITFTRKYYTKYATSILTKISIRSVNGLNASSIIQQHIRTSLEMLHKVHKGMNIKQVSVTVIRPQHSVSKVNERAEPQFGIFIFEVSRHSRCAFTQFENFSNNLTALPFPTPQLHRITLYQFVNYLSNM